MQRLCGIDYGSKLAGTTVVCLLDQPAGQVHFQTSVPKKDADILLLDLLLQYRPACIFMDAPLSLPGVYRDLPGSRNYFYREADRLLGAMSPMFLGGLTARAMQLKDSLQRNGLTVYETYPAAQARRLNLYLEGYKRESSAIIPVLGHIKHNHPALLFDIASVISWHHVDALLALLAAVRFTEGNYSVYGNAAEGEIIV